MELAPAPVSLSEGVFVLQSPPSLPPGADEVDEQAPVGPAVVDVELEDPQATASRPAAQRITPKLRPALWIPVCMKDCSSRRAWSQPDPWWAPASRGTDRARAASLGCREPYIIRP